MSEPNSPKTSGLTQAQALFAVLAGNSISRRERVYYRDGVLRSTFYSPLKFSDEACASYSLLIETINGEVADIYDVANTNYVINIEVLTPFVPTPYDLSIIEHSILITYLAPEIPKQIDNLYSNKVISITGYVGLLEILDDSAISNHTVQVSII
ncbi:hypothetical protein PQI64_11305 [Shewanella bicestrii]